MPRHGGLIALSIFFLCGSVLAGMAAVSMALPNSVLEPMWRLNPRGHQGLIDMHVWGILLLAGASVACAGAGVGLWLRQNWGHTMAFGVLLVQLVGDVLNVVSGAEPRAIVGVPIVAGLLFYLTRPGVRAEFGPASERNAEGPRGRRTRG
jgi:hypothetical protein